MKTLLLTLGLGCSGFMANAGELKGKITGTTEKHMLLRYTDAYGIRNFTDTVRINANGTFAASWGGEDMNRNATLIIPGGQRVMLYARGKDVLQVNITTSPYKVDYKGKWGTIASFLNAHPELANRLYTPTRQERPEVLTAAIDSAIEKRNTLASVALGDLRSAETAAFMEEYRSSNYYRGLMEKMNFMPAAAIQSQLNAQTFNQPTLLTDRYYRSFATDYLMAKITKDVTDSDMERKDVLSFLLTKAMHTVDEHSTDKTANLLIKGILLTRMLDEVKDMPELDTFPQHVINVLAEWRTNRQASSMADQLEWQLNDAMRHLDALAPGTAAPELTFRDVEGNTRTLSEFRGKLVYVDVWFNGCSGCVAAFPYWNELVKKFRGRNDIVFLSVSIDYDDARWKAGLAAYKPDGLHLNSPGMVDSEISKKLKATYAPVYMLVDKEGKLISARAEGPQRIDLQKYL